jgi:hypothetical protein
MTEFEVENMKVLMSSGFVFYYGNTFEQPNTWRQIVSIGQHPDEPSDVGYFGDDTYVAFYDIQTSSLRMVSDLTRLMLPLLKGQKLYG